LTESGSTCGLNEIVFCPKELEIPSDDIPLSERHYVEPSIFRGRSLSAFAWEFLDEGKKLVYCSLGTQCFDYANAPHLLRMIIEAFASMPEHQLVLASGGLDMELDEREPPNVLVVPSAPQLELLARARVAISHGGLGSVKEAIMARVPMIIVPFASDQPANGRRVEYHHLGRVIPPTDCSPERIKEAVLDLERDEQVRPKMETMSSIFWAYEAAAPAVRVVLQCVPRIDQNRSSADGQNLLAGQSS
jgi:MGT family glycosyltransferase